ncbi:acetylxylan esterase [Tundrisphaera sp. TA3]|uniref:glucuronyl esterase domain-containing protein n=1 Tax=Tundrisphaera sp. TA3 TaxID=3435775 RepID=UPI003EB9BA94
MLRTLRSLAGWALLTAPIGVAAQDSAMPPTFPAGIPDLLTTASGVKITTPEQWRDVRRPELLEFFAREMYGRSPGRPEAMTIAAEAEPAEALGGKAIREQVAIRLDGRPEGRTIHLLLYRPKAATVPVPAFLGINFQGNQSVNEDPAIIESKVKMAAPGGKMVIFPRGSESRRWPLETIIDRGYAVATFARGDLDPDRKDGFAESVRSDFPDLQNRPDNFGGIAAWAWGLSRALDYLETHPAIDAKRVAAFGHSRLGKASLWAGATDERFALVISNESGAGGAKLFRRASGESVRKLNTNFPHWFCENFRKYNDQDAMLPFDQHQVIALIAPRPAYVGSALEDKNADPEGEFAGIKSAEPAFRLLGVEGMPATAWPAVGEPSMGGIGYHVRPGVHDVTDFDWARYLDFADRHLRSRK